MLYETVSNTSVHFPIFIMTALHGRQSTCHYSHFTGKKIEVMNSTDVIAGTSMDRLDLWSSCLPVMLFLLFLTAQLTSAGGRKFAQSNTEQFIEPLHLNRFTCKPEKIILGSETGH